MVGPEHISKKFEERSRGETPEFIKRPAILHGGMHYLGGRDERHADIIDRLAATIPGFNALDRKSYKKGFMTTKDRFIDDRDEVTEIALRNNQVKDISRLKGRDPFVVGSGDLLYPEDTES